MINVTPKRDYTMYRATNPNENATLTGTLELVGGIKHLASIFPGIPTDVFLQGFAGAGVTVAPRLALADAIDVDPAAQLDYNIGFKQSDGSYTGDAINVGLTASLMYSAPDPYAGWARALTAYIPTVTVEQVKLAFLQASPTVNAALLADAKTWTDPFLKAMGG